MPLDDKNIGVNLTRMRGDLSQKDLAAKMRDRGWKWSQATVWSVEKGERPLRFAEAVDICWLLGYEVGSLVGTAEELQLDFFTNKFIAETDDLRDQLRKSMERQLEIAALMDSDGRAPDAAVRVAVMDTLWQAITRLYVQQSHEYKERLDAEEGVGEFQRAVLENWLKDRDRIRQEWYGEHQEKA